MLSYVTILSTFPHSPLQERVGKVVVVCVGERGREATFLYIRYETKQITKVCTAFFLALGQRMYVPTVL